MKKARKKMSRGKKTAVIIVVVIVALILAAIAGGSAFLYMKLHISPLRAVKLLMNVANIEKIEEEDTIPPELEDFETDVNVDEGENVDPDSVKNPEDVTWEDISSFEDDKLVNILLVGQDRRPGEGRTRSDVMMLVSYNPDNNKVSIISFLRDLYVKIPGYSDNRLNAAYVFGGFDLLKRSLSANFGISVDGCFEVDFDGFKEIMTVIGGVDIELTNAEASRMGLGQGGMRHLTPEQALAYARIRKIDSDFQRTNRQRNVVMAVYDKVKDLPADQLLEILNTVLPYIRTDMSNGEILSLFRSYVPALNGAQISRYSIPSLGDGTYYDATIRGMMVLVPYLGTMHELLQTKYLPF